MEVVMLHSISGHYVVDGVAHDYPPVGHKLDLPDVAAEEMLRDGHVCKPGDEPVHIQAKYSVSPVASPILPAGTDGLAVVVPPNILIMPGEELTEEQAALVNPTAATEDAREAARVQVAEATPGGAVDGTTLTTKNGPRARSSK